jgi:HlyD family secretion protein
VPTPSARHQASAHTPSVQALTAQGQPSQGITAEEASQAAAELQAFRTLETRSSRKKRNRVLRITLIVVGAVALVALAVFLIGRMLFPSDTGVQEAVTGTVEQGTYLEEITGNGVLAPFESVAVTPEIDGTIAELKVAEGDMVTAGQLLFTIDSPDLDSQIAAAQRGVDSANLNVSGAVTGRDEATRAADAAYTSYTSLKATVDWGRQAAQAAGEPFDEMAAQQQLDAAWQQYEASKSQISSAKQQVAAANLQLADAQAALDAAWKNGEKRSVYAPITGQVVTLNLERGMKLSTQASSGQAPLRIADLSKMKVTLNINELDIIKLRVDQVATVSFDAVADLTSEAKVSRISTVSAAGATAQESMGGSGGSGIVTFPVEMIIENPDSRLKIGMSAQAGIVIKRLENVLIVPALALQGDGDQVTLQVKGEDGSFAPVEVKVLERNDSTAAIEGLTAGAIKAGDEVKLEATVTTSSGQGGAMMGGSVSVGMG